MSGIALLASTLGWAHDDGLSLTAAERAFLESFQGKVKVGMEIEVSDPSIQQMIRWFDFDRYQKEFPEALAQLSDVQVRGYLDDPANFDSLPTALRDRLTEGLGSHRVELHAPKPKIAPGVGVKSRGGLINASGKPLSAQTPLIQPPARAHSLPQAEPGKLILPDSKLHVSEADRARAEWLEIQRRWRALKPEECLQAIRLQRLPPSDLAILVASNRIRSYYLRMREDLPAAVKKLMGNFGWSKDGAGMVEFRHRAPLQDPIRYLRQVKAFGEYAGVRREMADPWRSRGRFGEMPYGYHFHLTLEDTDLTGRIRDYNLLKAVRATAQGTDAFQAGQVTYRHQSEKGLVRQVDRNRIEVRAQHGSPETELVEALRYMSNEHEVQTALARELTPAVLAKLVRRADPLDPEFMTALGQFRGSCPGCDFSSTELAQTLSTALGDSSDSVRFNAARVADALEAGSPGVRARSREILLAKVNAIKSDRDFPGGRALQGVRDSEVEAALIKLLGHREERVRQAAVKGLLGTQRAETLERLAEALPGTNDEVAELIGKAMARAFGAGEFAHVRNRMEGFLSSTRKGEALAAVIAFEGTKNPEIVMKMVPLLFSGTGLLAAYSEVVVLANLSRSVVRSVLAQAAKAPPASRAYIGFILQKSKPHGPEEQRAIAALLKEASHVSREYLLRCFDPGAIDSLAAHHLLKEIDALVNEPEVAELQKSPAAVRARQMEIAKLKEFAAAVRARQPTAPAASGGPGNCLGGVLVQLRIPK